MQDGQPQIIRRAKKLQGLLTLPGDKSISHRAALVSLLCREPIEARNFAEGDDCWTSVAAVETLGGRVDKKGTTLFFTPPEGNSITSPDEPIDCGNSGTTMRLLAGLLAGAGVTAEMVGDESLQSRPMRRIIEPLRQMNADITGTESENGEDTAPLKIQPRSLGAIDYILPVASAQVKSAILLAGVASRCGVTVREKIFTRDHTERMIRFLGGEVTVEDVQPEIVPDPNDPRKKRRVMPTDEYRRTIAMDRIEALGGGVIEIPGDFSLAANFIAAALMVPGSHLILNRVGLNRTRTGFLTVIRQMGAEITIKNRQETAGEPCGDIEVTFSKLKPRKISGEVIVSMIDEVPLLAVLAASMEGTTIIRDAGELRHKESDRLHATATNLQAMGVKIGELEDGLAIEGTGELNAAEIDSMGDHRIAMAFAVAGMAAHGKTVITNPGAVSISCPDFYTMLEGLRVS